MNFHSPKSDSILNRRSWFKRAGASLVGLAVGSRLTADQSQPTTANATVQSATKTRRKAPPQPGINHGFDEGFF